MTKRKESKNAAKPAKVKVAPKVTKKARTTYVQYDTIFKKVGGGFSNPGEMRICKIGRHKVAVQRDERLDRNGKTVHAAAVVKRDGTLGPVCKSHADASWAVSKALKKTGVETKFKRRK